MLLLVLGLNNKLLLGLNNKLLLVLNNNEERNSNKELLLALGLPHRELWMTTICWMTRRQRPCASRRAGPCAGQWAAHGLDGGMGTRSASVSEGGWASDAGDRWLTSRGL